MAKNLGTFTFAANFQVKAAEALDPRVVATSKADLINKDNWPSDGDTIYVYKGLIVDCGEDGVYRLIDPTKALATDYSGWQRIDAGGVQIDNIFTYKGNVTDYESLPENANTGDVYNVESEFTITIEPELGSEEEAVVKTYPAGTNVAWNGSGWDALAGAIDLSSYATKEEVSTIRTDVSTNATNISNLSTALGETNLEVAKKVDAVEGSSLITSDKLALIDTNASEIQALEDLDLDNRLKTVESAFKGEGGTIDLGDITSSITAQGERITALETNSATKTELGTLQTQVNGHGDRLTAIETLNTEQSTQISGLTTRVENVEKHGEAITNLTTTVNGHTQEISDIKSSISGLAVKSVASGEKVLAADTNGALSTSIALGYDNENKKIQLTGIEGAVISELDASDFIKDGMINSVAYDTATKVMTITWNTDAGKEATEIDMTGLVDTYTAGSGLKVENNEFSVKLDTNENNKLTVSDSGLLVDISTDIAALESSIDTKISNAFTWEEVTE